MRPGRRWPAGATALALATMVGCGHGHGDPVLRWSAPARRSPRRATSCWSRPATRSGAAISRPRTPRLTRLADREHGVADPALDFWSELLALLRCEPLPRIPRSSPHDRPLADPWDGLRRLAQIERVRLAREGRPAAAPPPDGGHLKLGLGEQQMVWPVENELWTDEAPMPALVSRCVAADAPQGTPGGPDALAAPARPAGRVRGRAGVVGGRAAAAGASGEAAVAGAGGGAQHQPRRSPCRRRAARAPGADGAAEADAG